MMEQKKDPGALAGATGADDDNASKSLRYRHRAEWANALCYALEKTHPNEATAICASYLNAYRTSGPAVALFDNVRGEAAIWADSAYVHEVEAVVLAGLRRLGQMAIGEGARKRLLIALWDSLTDRDRLNFVDRFTGRRSS